MAATLRAAILQYKSAFVPSELPLVKLKQDFVGGSYKEKKCPVFNGDNGIESLFYVEERFRKIAERTLNWDTGLELFNGFEDILIDTALANWEDIIAPIADADKTVVRFEQALQEMYRKYVVAESRDTQIEYYKTLRKPMKANPLDHSNRMLTLARFGNKLPGIEPPLTEDQIKNCIFHSFPPKWQQQFIRSGQRVANTPLSEIIEFMSNEKSFADAQDPSRNQDKSKKTPSKEEGSKSSSSFKKRKTSYKSTPQKKYNKGNFQAPTSDDECPIHGGHRWSKCFDNPNGESYKPRGQDGRRSDGGRTGGRGRGGSQGRGNGGRGNNTGRGNSQYNFDSTVVSEPPTQKKTSFQGSTEQHHFDQIGHAETWAWDASEDKTPTPGT
jgi:hypothetical protein